MRDTLNPIRRSTKILKVMSAGEFVSIAKGNSSAIKRSRFVPPQLGSSGMGKFIVELSHEPRR